MRKKQKHVERLNLYLERDIYNQIKANAQAEYLPVSTWLKQFLYKNLHEKNNSMLNPQNHEC